MNCAAQAIRTALTRDLRLIQIRMASSSPKYPALTTGPFNWIGNQRVGTSSPETFDDIEPRTGKVLAKVHTSGQSDIDKAVQAAREAFPSWSQVKLLYIIVDNSRVTGLQYVLRFIQAAILDEWDGARSDFDPCCQFDSRQPGRIRPSRDFGQRQACLGVQNGSGHCDRMPGILWRHGRILDRPARQDGWWFVGSRHQGPTGGSGRHWRLELPHAGLFFDIPRLIFIRTNFHINSSKGTLFSFKRWDFTQAPTPVRRSKIKPDFRHAFGKWHQPLPRGTRSFTSLLLSAL